VATVEERFQLKEQEIGSDGKTSAARAPKSAEPLGLALSGGGVRAALFSLGVVIGLIETGCHRRVSCVASVSGGSILNAALAHAQSLGRFPSVAEFEKLASTMATNLARKGVFALTFRSALRYFLPIGSVLVIVILMPFIPFPKNLEFIRTYVDTDIWRVAGMNKWTWLVCMVASFPLWFWRSRGLLQEQMYHSVLSAVAGNKRLYVKNWSAPPEEGSDVMHVLVATDLLSGEPIYFSNKFIYCRPYGWSTPENIRTEEALYSSAAFPVVFPPKKLKITQLKFQNGDMPGQLPRVLRLADGGVYNNLGFDWFDILLHETQASPPSLWPFGELSLEPPRIEKTNVIVVNAGAPSSRVRSLPPLPVARIMSVLYDNTVRPRVELLQRDKFPVIDIEQTPLELAKSLVDEEIGCKDRALALAMKLKGKTEEFWADFSRDTAGTRTKLTPAGSRAAARLMLHGYLSSLVLFHIRFGGNLPNRIRGEQYFLELVTSSGHREAPLAAENKGTPETTKTESSSRA
jgi:predicted acylesterase/phospholipase RssA